MVPHWLGRPSRRRRCVLYSLPHRYGTGRTAICAIPGRRPRGRPGTGGAT
ncbi:MAG: hypothetical protein AVDCRST_MAG64-2225 [uncultured Phycisphaerae bacterium]|uniref:Uncharacterized protein n=1 Tax=uncultured Phycisphaerae bacterium TaxID=904963 RepID=A0A6J4P7Z7_9BACT|nr:MAG: hypothetical protein AVDCRST_MAG64-2225 [uncultured Phycisphaerae bacterium]